MRERALDLRAIAENPRETGDSATAEALERRISAHVAMLTACSAEAVNATRACRPDPRGGMPLKSLERAGETGAGHFLV